MPRAGHEDPLKLREHLGTEQIKARLCERCPHLSSHPCSVLRTCGQAVTACVCSPLPWTGGTCTQPRPSTVPSSRLPGPRHRPEEGLGRPPPRCQLACCLALQGRSQGEASVTRGEDPSPFPPPSGRSAWSPRRGRPCAADVWGTGRLASLVSLRPHRPVARLPEMDKPAHVCLWGVKAAGNPKHRWWGALPLPLVPPHFRLSRVWGHMGRTPRAEGHLGTRLGWTRRGDCPGPRSLSGGGSFRASVLSAAFFLDLFAF